MTASTATSQQDQFAALFRDEARDLLRQTEAALLDLQQQPAQPELVAEIFRYLHTVKGSGSMFGFDALAAFTHRLENAFDAVRIGRLPITTPLIDLALESIDVMRALLEGTATSAPDPLLDRIAALLGAAPQPSAAPHAAEPEPTTLHRIWQIRFVPGPAMMRFGADPLLLIRELSEMGTLTAQPSFDQLPALADLDPTRCYLAWTLELQSTADANALRDVFMFVENDCALDITALQPNDTAPTGPSPADPVPADPVPVDPQPRPAADLPSAPTATPQATRRPEPTEGAIRVASSKLDELVNLVGELVTVQARLSELAARSGDLEISSVAEDVERLTSSLRESSMRVRMMPVRDTFERFRRLVYSLARDLGKQVHLTLEGTDTELDKNVLEQLGDPLLHLIRNSMDHGLEAADDRLSTGKPAEGRLRLSARYAGASVLITVADDGRGIDPDRVRRRALERGLIQPDQPLTRQQVFNLLFEPGFSTAEQVTDLSGRGVGMDVVRKHVEDLRGTLEVDSTLGAGTEVTLRIPLTLAIIDGLLVTVGEQFFVLPLAHTLETIELSRHEIDTNGHRRLLDVRGELVPYIRLRDLFAIDAPLPDFEQVMIVLTESGRFGLVVDHVLGDTHTMVKSLGRLYRHVAELSGATILGNGSVALILDPQRLVADVIRTPNRPPKPLR